jgi:ferrochelatase
MKTAVLLLNFGEPANPTPEEVIPFLERIFSLNAALMGPATPEEVRARSRKLAEERAPGLIEEYRLIGGSPLHQQSLAQAEGLEAELRRRGHDVTAYLGMQFTRPSIAEALESARAAGAERVIGLPVYPLAGPTTTMAALEEMRSEIARMGWEVEVGEITGWHRHPGYVRLRGDAIRALLAEEGVSLDDPGTKLVFSAHGTPLKYLEGGSRYEEYVRDFCALLAAEVGAPEYLLGYQNHTNRPGVKWTQPDIDRVVADADARRIVVDPVSFMHEQSETLAELDHELREEAEERGLEFHRVRIPYAVPAFIDVLADLVEPLLGSTPPAEEGAEIGALPLRRCECRDLAGTYCLNAGGR